MKTEQQQTVGADHLRRNALVYVRQVATQHVADVAGHPDSTSVSTRCAPAPSRSVGRRETSS